VSIDGAAASANQAKLTSPFGLADFTTGNIASSPDPGVRMARPLMVADTAGHHDDQEAIVRLRDMGKDSLSLMFYKVDDYNGTAAGLAPGSSGYAAAAAAAAYQTDDGATLISNPARSEYKEARLVNIDAGDLIAMELIDNSKGKTYWGFAQANETVHGQHVGHLWNYGLNTFGWEEHFRGGDRDFNDLGVQVDFTSASGSQPAVFASRRNSPARSRLPAPRRNPGRPPNPSWGELSASLARPTSTLDSTKSLHRSRASANRCEL
jgi:hypothetical protein